MSTNKTISTTLFVAILTCFATGNAHAQGKGSNPNRKPFIELNGQIIEVEGELSTLRELGQLGHRSGLVPMKLPSRR